jgi:endonuclease/exonuclease/phosphatase family metal-dependent hydrolase
MRIVTWNCGRGPLERKLEALRALNADLAVITEAPPPTAAMSEIIWYPSGKCGIGVWARAPFSAHALQTSALPNCVVPLRVEGPVSFNLLAVWTKLTPSYREAFANGLEAYEHLIAAGPTIVAGDFNGNANWDTPTTRIPWRSAFTRLSTLGLSSAYHTHTGEDFGTETTATHFHQYKLEKPYHVDFCFVPTHWMATGCAVSVGTFAEWHRFSDHVPIIVDLAHETVV